MKIALLCNNRMAVPALQKLAGAGALCAVGITDMHKEVVAVFGEQAREHGVALTVFAKKGRNASMKEWVVATGADVVFVVTFPWRIPREVFSVPRYGFLNFHGGLLPEMRGPDPIFETIKQRRTIAGVTVYQVDDNFDTGPVILKEEIAVPVHFTYGMLSSQLAYMAADMCVKVKGMMAKHDRLEGVPQGEANANYWPAAAKKDIFINWQEMDTDAIIALVNACNPSLRSGAATYVNGWGIGICFASPVALQGDASAYTAGTILTADTQNGMIVYCKDGRGLKLDVVYTEEGFFPGYMLGTFGIGPGMSFN